LLRDPTIASKNWVYRQYDHTVRTGTLVKPGSDAAVFLSAARTNFGGDKRLQFALLRTRSARRRQDCGRRGCAQSHLLRAKPLAVTDNLNFGNPYKPENFWQLREAVEGAAEACRVFGTPVTGGNVSLYNESPVGVVDPTPTIGWSV